MVKNAPETSGQEFLSSIDSVIGVAEDPNRTPNEIEDAIQTLLEEYETRFKNRIEIGVVNLTRGRLAELLQGTEQIGISTETRERIRSMYEEIEQIEAQEASSESEIRDLIRKHIKDPSQLKGKLGEIKSPALLAVFAELRKNPKYLKAMQAAFESSAKTPKASERALIKKFKAEGIETADRLDEAIAKTRSEYRQKHADAEDLNNAINQDVQLNKENPSDASQASIQERQGEYRRLHKEVIKLEQRLEDLQAVAPYYDTSRLSAEEMLYKIEQYKMSEEGENNPLPEDLTKAVNKAIKEQADKMPKSGEVSRIEQKTYRVRDVEIINDMERVLKYIKPTLPATLKAISKTAKLASTNEKELLDILKKRDNINYVAEWMQTKGEKAKKMVPALMGYLQLALSNGDLNEFSRKKTQELLDNLRAARNQLIQSQINEDPKHSSLQPQEKMAVFLQEINAWDENSVLLNPDVFKELSKNNYKSVAKFIGKRGAGVIALSPFGLLAPIGLFAPEIIRGLQFGFKHKKEIKGGLKTTGKTLRFTGRALGTGWAITKGFGKVITYPFRRKKAA